MVRVYIPGCGLALRVLATINGMVWHRGVAHTESKDVELVSGERIPASAIRRIQYSGPGTWLPAREARSVILWLSMIGGMDTKALWELSHAVLDALEPEDEHRPQVDRNPHAVAVGEA